MPPNNGNRVVVFTRFERATAAKLERVAELVALPKGLVLELVVRHLEENELVRLIQALKLEESRRGPR
jgi:hypothetical protein